MNLMIVTHSGGSPYHGPNMRSYYMARVFVKEGCKVQIITSSFFHKYFYAPEFNDAFLFQKIDDIDYCWIKTLRYRKRGIRQVFNQLDFVKNCFMNSKKIVRQAPDAIRGVAEAERYQMGFDFVQRPSTARYDLTPRPGMQQACFGA